MISINIEKTEITSPGLRHLDLWITLIQENFTEDNVFEKLHDLATALESWKVQFYKCNPTIPQDVVVIAYGKDVVLCVCNHKGEFIKICNNIPEPKTPKTKRISRLIKFLRNLLPLLLISCVSYPNHMLEREGSVMQTDSEKMLIAFPVSNRRGKFGVEYFNIDSLCLQKGKTYKATIVVKEVDQ
jgi:hypothetical protein